MRRDNPAAALAGNRLHSAQSWHDVSAETPTTPLGPCKIAIPFITSRTTQPAIFFVSAGACDFSDDFGSGVGARAWTCAAFGSAAGVELLARAGCWFTLSAIALRSIR